MTTPTELPPAGAPGVLYLIDLSAYVFRAYHAIAPLTSYTGEPTQATYGTTTMLAKLVGERQPEFLGVAADSPGATFRDAIDARYKKNRPKPPPDLIQQLKRSREIVDAYRIPVFGAPGLEADDLIAVAVARARAKGLTVVIASSDKDLMQLVDDKTMLWDAMRDRVYGPPEVEAKFGVKPSQMRDLLALMGDASDNVPGVPSVGQKTAAALLAQFGTLDAVYADLDAVKKPKVREALQKHEDEARVSQKLVTLRSDHEVDLDLEKLRYGGADTERLHELFVELGFVRFIKEVRTEAKLDVEYTLIRERAELEEFAKAARAAGQLAIEVHGTTREPMRAALCGFGLSHTIGHGFYVPVGHRHLGVGKQLSVKDVLEVVGPLLSDPELPIIGHDLKYSQVMLARQSQALEGVVFDTMLASYVLDPETSHELAIAAERDAGVDMVSYDTLAPKQRGKPQAALDEIDVEEAVRYAAAFPEVCLRLREQQKPRLVELGVDKLLRELELPLSSVLAGMEQIGVLIDPAQLNVLGAEMSKELASLEARAREVSEEPDLNVASPKQLEAVLFGKLELKSVKKTKTGRSTDAEALEAIAKDHELPRIVLEHRGIAKLKGTYVDALPKLVHPETGRIHTKWSQAVAATGRLSSQDPNLQNIPIRTATGKQIRHAFIAPEGMVFLSADYSQIELRVLAHLSGDEELCDAFNAGKDVHARTASAIFDVPEDEVTEDMRRQAKTVNFGVIYGMGEVALAKRLGIKRAQAASFIKAYFERYSGVQQFMEETMVAARRELKVATLLGRIRMLTDLRSSDRVRRSYAERIAQNTPIQGTAADLLKLAMVRLREPVVPGARMVMTVHDELNFEVPEAKAERASKKIKEAMEGVFTLNVPLVVDVGWGPTWAEAH